MAKSSPGRTHRDYRAETSVEAVATVRAGEVALARRGEPHTFANRTDQELEGLG
ncbi:MAG TPA: hypothetical protein VNV17_06605 [Solirubrobacteraceae bacterium]|nr:hypothetical protein [Solirubrobacteraceae bacterium]